MKVFTLQDHLKKLLKDPEFKKKFIETADVEAYKSMMLFVGGLLK